MLKTDSSQLKIVYQPIDRLADNPRNPRIHSPRQIRQIAASIKAFGFANPILVNASNMIVAGHGRAAAARLLKMSTVPTICLQDLTPEQLKAYLIADNRITQNASWDAAALAIEIQEILAADPDFDVTLTGFEVAELDLVLQDATAQEDKDDAFDADLVAKAISEPGDLWRLGHHKILCGNALEPESYKALMGDLRAAIVFIDPPYNVTIAGNVSGKGKVKHADFQMACNDLNSSEFTDFLSKAFNLLAKYSISGSVHFVAMDWRHQSEVLAAGKRAEYTLLNLCVWVKERGALGSFYRSRHELFFVFKSGKGKNVNNIQLGKFGRTRTNVWEFPSASAFSKSGDEGNLLALHPTVKPVALVRRRDLRRF